MLRFNYLYWRSVVLAGWVLVTLACWAHKAEAQADPSPNIVGNTIEQTAADKGYTVEEIRGYFPPIQAWNKYDKTLDPLKRAAGYAADRFPAPPPAGVHPRIFFGPDELDGIRERIKTQHLARQMMELLRGRCIQIRPTPDAWQACSKQRQAERDADPDNPGIGILKLRAMGYHGPWVGGWVNELAAGRESQDLQGKWHLPMHSHNRTYLMHLMPFEAYRCLIDNDKAGGERIGKALATICRLTRPHLNVFTAKKDYQRFYQLIGGDSIGVTYDWAHPFMSEVDRETVRQFISDATTGISSIGIDHLPAFPAGTSNWNTIHMHLTSLVLAIEGEEGYDHDVYLGCVEAMRKWCYVASGPEGAPYEGFNKSSYAAQHLIAMAKRGDDFLGTQWVKNAGRRYHLAVMLPWATEHIYETQSGPDILPRDFAPFKFAYPDDPIIDLVYGNTVKHRFGKQPRLQYTNLRTSYSPYFAYHLYYDDPIGTTPDGSYDFEKRASEVIEIMKRSNEPTTYYSDYRGLLTTRTSWNRDAAFLFFETRNVPGGHTWDSRNDFIIASHGRCWNYRPMGTEGGSDQRSVILIDGVGQGHQCVQGRMLSLNDTERATVATGDATWAYSFKGDLNGEPISITPNDSRLNKSTLPWMDQSWSFLPGWRESKKGGLRHGHWSTHNPIEYAYRTVALIKSKRPYFVLRDDMKKDGEKYEYKWIMQTLDDLKVIQPAKRVGKHIDLIIGDNQGRRLLVRVFEAGSSGGITEQTLKHTMIVDYSKTYRNKTSHYKRLEIPTKDTHGNFTILLFPHKQGDSLPDTQYMTENSKLTVTIDGRTDRLRITRDSAGMSKLEME